MAVEVKETWLRRRSRRSRSGGRSPSRCSGVSTRRARRRPGRRVADAPPREKRARGHLPVRRADALAGVPVGVLVRDQVIGATRHVEPVDEERRIGVDVRRHGTRARSRRGREREPATRASRIGRPSITGRSLGRIGAATPRRRRSAKGNRSTKTDSPTTDKGAGGSARPTSPNTRGRRTVRGLPVRRPPTWSQCAANNGLFESTTLPERQVDTNGTRRRRQRNRACSPANE